MEHKPNIEPPEPLPPATEADSATRPAVPAPAKSSGLSDKAGNELHPTHPDHGPMHLIPRQEDGRIATYYYCSKAELYDMQIPAPPARRQRRDGFTLERQEQFLEYVRGGASGREAARRVGISPTTAYNLYNSPDGAAFRTAWDEAAKVTDIVLEDTGYDRAVNGQEEIVYYKGQRVGTRWKYDNNLLMKLLRARNPLKYAPLSEIEGWLRHRGIAPPADVDGALGRLRDAEAEWGRRLPGEESPGRLEAPTGKSPATPLIPGEAPQPGAGPLAAPEAGSPDCRAPRFDGPAEDPRTGPAGDSIDPLAASTSSTSSTLPEGGQADDPLLASTSSTSSGNGQAEGCAGPSASTGPEESAHASMSSTSAGSGQEGMTPAPCPDAPPAEDGSIIYYRPPPRPRLIAGP